MKALVKYLFIAIVVIVLGIWAAAVSIPNTLNPGDVISSSQLNENFTALKTAIDALEATVGSLSLPFVGTTDSNSAAFSVSNADGRAIEGSSSSIGVIGISDARAVVGTQGSTSCAGTYAVGGCATTGDGVVGRATSGRAGFFDGDVEITGSLSKGSGSFKIDHPLDPLNKYLYHSFVESPDMMNIYNGHVSLNETGEAWVELPEWFDALNREFRYQLTAIGAPGPNLYIAEKIMNNQFKIAGGQAGTEVSWQVTGIRHDPYAEANRIAVEEWKPLAEQGSYLYPEAYGFTPNPEVVGQISPKEGY